MRQPKVSLGRLNEMGREEFTGTLDGIYEGIPRIVESAWVQRPFADMEALASALDAVVDDLSEDDRLGLLRAHPDLGPGVTMGEVSREEQARSGLAEACSDASARLVSGRLAYRERFGFPFIVCVRGLGPEEIAEAMERRLTRSVEEERAAALAEVALIARARLAERVEAS
jgi:2-oxo-4-hydroxy-4-carboxy-5-ureidoimidazoline decarboxylase